MTAWTPDSFAAEQFAIGRKYLPPQPGQPLAEEWGDEATVRELVRRRGGDGPARIENEYVVIVARKGG